MREITVGYNESGQRLDKLLGKFLPGAGRSFLYRMLRKKNITLNGHRAEGNEILQEGDAVRIWFSEETLEKFMSAPAQENAEPGAPAKPALAASCPPLDRDRILYEDQDILVYNKPAGVLSQPDDSGLPSVVDQLLCYMLQEGEITESQLTTFRPSVANRLDRNTSGLILCGKSLRGLQELSRLIRERGVNKDYLAVAEGMLREGGRLEGTITRDSAARTSGYHAGLSGDGVRAELEYKPVWTDGQKTLLMVRLHTGRTHQIRVQFAAIGHPLAGDPKYGHGRRTDHQFLHAYRMTMPDGRKFLAEVPDSFRKLVKGYAWEHGKPEDFEALPWKI